MRNNVSLRHVISDIFLLYTCFVCFTPHKVLKNRKPQTVGGTKLLTWVPSLFAFQSVEASQQAGSLTQEEPFVAKMSTILT